MISESEFRVGDTVKVGSDPWYRLLGGTKFLAPVASGAEGTVKSPPDCEGDVLVNITSGDDIGELYINQECLTLVQQATDTPSVTMPVLKSNANSVQFLIAAAAGVSGALATLGVDCDELLKALDKIQKDHSG